MIADMIGVGVFTSLGFEVAALPAGFPILALWAVGGVLALCGALVYGELAAALPRSGGEYNLLSAIFHPGVGFLAGWISITVGFAAPAALAAMTFGTYLNRAFETIGAVPMSVGIVLAVTLVHLLGTRTGSVFQNFSTVHKVALILVMIVAGALALNPQPVSFTPQPG